MNVFEVVSFSVSALRGHKLRSALSMLGVSIGTGAVVLLTGLGAGAQNYVADQFASLGTNMIIVLPGKTETTGALPGMGGTPQDLTVLDAQTILRAIPEVVEVAPVSMSTDTVAYRQRSRQVAILGTTAEMLELRNLEVRVGQFLPRQDWERGSPVVVLGSALEDELFPDSNPVGEVVRVGDSRMRVVGVAAPKGQSLGVNIDDIAFVPVATAMQMFNRTSLFRIMLRTRHPAQAETAIAKVRALLIERHEGEEDFTIVTQDALASSFGSIFGTLTLAVAGIAAISLSVAGIGIMNVMLVSVSERTSEVGLLKAVGAGRRQVLSVFLTEAALLSLTGGIVGVALGWLLAESVRWYYPAIRATPPGWAIASALGVSLVVGALFGVLPAIRATKLDPILALRSR